MSANIEAIVAKTSEARGDEVIGTQSTSLESSFEKHPALEGTADVRIALHASTKKAIALTTAGNGNNLKGAPKASRESSTEKTGTPAVTPEQLKTKVKTEATKSMKTPRKEPETTLLLDKEEAVSDLEKSPLSDHDIIKFNEDDNVSARADPDLDNKDDSSNDDSSYFADPSHLPKPKSGRRFSWSSTTSAQNSVTRQHINNAASRESDASLSLSDDSDEHLHHVVKVQPQPALYPQQQNFLAQQQQPYLQQQPFLHHQQQPFLPPQQQHQPFLHPQPVLYQQPHQFVMPPAGGVPELYPQQIMPRMHSYNSLVSTSSQNSSASDTSVQDELKNVAGQPRRTGSAVPSGRRSPILGEHPPSRTGGGGSHPMALFASPSTVNPGPSPPTILQAYPSSGYITHPQPHSMTSEQLAAWASASQQNSQMIFGEPRGGLPSTASASRDSDLAYSGDSDTQQHKDHPIGEPRRDRRKHRQQEGDVVAPLVASPRAAQGAGRDRGVEHPVMDERGFKVYWQRWLMLMVRSCWTVPA